MFVPERATRGGRQYPHRLGLARRSRQRFRDKLRVCQENFDSGRWTESVAARHVEPLLAFVRRAESFGFRK